MSRDSGPHRENWADLRPASRESAKRAPMTLRHTNFSAAPSPNPGPAAPPAPGRAFFVSAGGTGEPDHEGFSGARLKTGVH